jgi:hypothetical protein
VCHSFAALQLSRISMAISRLSVIVAVLACCCCLVQVSQCGGNSKQNYTSMFSFGDSLTDTGNLLASSQLPFTTVGRFPYGMTYFHRPTGRCSDGRLVVDFLGECSSPNVALVLARTNQPDM